MFLKAIIDLKEPVIAFKINSILLKNTNKSAISFRILNFLVYHFSEQLSWDFLRFCVKDLCHYVVHLLWKDLPTQSLLQHLFYRLFADLSSILLIQHLCNQLPLV